ncbi:50S ribosomal protein L30 [candidate division WOR-3 bacterium JGI_Cruoil_03_44_89]|uniref:50S ribosomal protein L30 n=1 Tax=candidate division WOR-3 bacterium JGI_Cruoil_03_44_89 TaxID=1973748 RepID=A0A235BWH9_UNCW3|nr:MAG: 50S ribosomal protein L30 [candidate division WOR-3 bacterium JGI_Cruoil_03_44_89]
MKKIKVIQIKSKIGARYDQKRTLLALGLHHPHDERIHDDTPQIRGMITKVRHLVRVEEME